jgi:hypothetical protein
MEDELLSRAEVIRDPAAGPVFASSRLRRMLMLFASEPLSLSEAAQRLKIDLKRLHYHVLRLVKLGLVEVSGERRRAGRAIKLYRATSEIFFVPEELLPKPFGDELSAELRACLGAEASKSSRGLLLYVGPKGEPVGRVVKQEVGTSEAFELWRILKLSIADAARLRSELEAVLQKFQAPSQGASHVFLVHAAAARRRDQSGSVDNP